MRARLIMLLVAAVAALQGSSPERGEARVPDACPPGEWIRSQTAAWLRRAVVVAGYEVTGCTGSAWIAATSRTAFYVWATEPWRTPTELRPHDQPTPVPTYTDGVRIVWQAQGLGIWVEPGPSPADTLPGRSALGWLQTATRRLPRSYHPIALMRTPPAVLARCRSDPLLRPACPTRIPRIGGWRTYPREVEGIFGIERGGEIPGRPELMRPPAILHLEVAVRPERWVPFRWPTTGAVTLRDGLVREPRDEPLLLGRVRWGGRDGTVALAPAFPRGGSQGNHLVFRWRQRGESYVVGLHAWEPLREAYATLRRVVASLPRR